MRCVLCNFWKSLHSAMWTQCLLHTERNFLKRLESLLIRFFKSHNSFQLVIWNVRVSFYVLLHCREVMYKVVGSWTNTLRYVGLATNRKKVCAVWAFLLVEKYFVNIQWARISKWPFRRALLIVRFLTLRSIYGGSWPPKWL